MSKDRKLRRKVRNSYIISTVSIALVLFLVGSVGYLIITALDATDRIKESVTVYVMLEEGTDDEQREVIRKNLTEREEVREVLFVSKQMAAEDFREYAGDDFEQFLDFNPLPDSFEVRLAASGPDAERLRVLEQDALTWTGVEEVVYQRNVIEKIGTNIGKFNLILLLFGGALLFISLILLNNTIRVTIFSKRYVISTMKLVGATKGFIMRPFMRSALLQGFYAALIATFLLAAMLWGLHEGLPEIRLGTGGRELLWIVGGMFVGGVFISLIFTIFALNKFIKMPTGAVHYY